MISFIYEHMNDELWKKWESDRVQFVW